MAKAQGRLPSARRWRSSISARIPCASSPMKGARARRRRSSTKRRSAGSAAASSRPARLAEEAIGARWPRWRGSSALPHMGSGHPGGGDRRRARRAQRPEFLDRAEQAIGAPIQLLSGTREAELSALGVVSDMHEPDGVVGDLGGGSLELIDVDGGKTRRGRDPAARRPRADGRVRQVAEAGARRSRARRSPRPTR